MGLMYMDNLGWRYSFERWEVIVEYVILIQSSRDHVHSEET